jgi:xylose dehydrogenase (NAD/NADP)
MTTLRWGVLGPGRIAPRLVRAVAACRRGELIAVASRDAARARAFAEEHGIARSYAGYETLLADPDIDVVYISLPNHLHAPWAIRALEAGKHVLSEKPIALRAADVDAIAAAAHAAGRVAAEAFMSLHHPQTIRAIELARDGSLGPLELVRGSFSFFLTHPNDPRIDPAMGGGSLWDVGCYPVSFARRLAGEEPSSIAASARLDDRGVDRTFIGQLTFPGGLLAQFDSGFAAPFRQVIEIVGQEATLTLGAPFLTWPDGPEPTLELRRQDAISRVEVPVVDQYALEVDDLTAAILDGAAPRVSLAFSRGTIATLEALDRAARVPPGGGADR